MAFVAANREIVTCAFPRILAVADREMCTMLERSLQNLGFEVSVVTDARAAASAVFGSTPEAIVLCAPMQAGDAFAIIANLRRITDVPILLISGEVHANDKVRALTGGADDFIAAPFDVEEVAAYIRARLRRPRMRRRDMVTFADLTIDVSQRKVVRGRRAIELSTREFDLLLTLARHPEQVFTRSQLLDLVWGVDRDVTPATVETYISYLRSKIDCDGGPELIHTLRGVGYTMRLSTYGAAAQIGSSSFGTGENRRASPGNASA